MKNFNPHLRIEIRQEPREKQLTREVFYFWLDTRTMTIYLDEYFQQKRETTRHGWKSYGTYQRVDRRRNNINAPIISDAFSAMVVSSFANETRSLLHMAE